MLGWRWISGYGNELCELPPAILTFRRFEIRNINVRALEELFPFSFQLKKSNASGHDAAHNERPRGRGVRCFVHSGNNHGVKALSVTSEANTLRQLLKESYLRGRFWRDLRGVWTREAKRPKSSLQHSRFQ